MKIPFLTRRYAGPPKPWKYEAGTFIPITWPPTEIPIVVPSVCSIDGVSWHEAPVPPRRHTCWPQTVALGRGRCACGAMQTSDGFWIERNSR